MKYFVSLLLIISFIGIGVFSFSLFDPNMMDDSSGGCIASAIDGTTCSMGLMAMTLHHISAFQTLTRTVVPPTPSWLLLIASLLLVPLSMFLFDKNLLLLKPELFRERWQDLRFHSLRSLQKIISWLSLFELSPSLR